MTTYVNSATCCAAEIEQDGDGKWKLIASDAEGNVEVSSHKSEKAAYRAMLAFRSGWERAAAPCEPIGPLGAYGEEAAAQMLERTGHRILDRSWMCPAGEVDIVAEKDGVIVFVDVRTRRGSSDFTLLDANAARTRRRQLEGIARAFAEANVFSEAVVRFDVVAVSVLDGDRAFIKHHIGAYSSE